MLWIVLIDKDKLNQLSADDLERVRSLITKEIMTNQELYNALKPQVDALVEELIRRGGGSD